MKVSDVLNKILHSLFECKICVARLKTNLLISMASITDERLKALIKEDLEDVDRTYNEAEEATKLVDKLRLMMLRLDYYDRDIEEVVEEEEVE